MISLLNIGNTHTWIQNAQASQPEIIATGEFTPGRIPEGPCAAACVVPELRSMLQEHDVFLVSLETVPWLDLSRMKNPEKIGADRLANAALLIEEGRLPAVTIDFGTAVNVEVIDPEGRMLGGVIFPGRRLMRKALNLYTAQLPLAEYTGELPPFPGNSTVPALQLGTDGTIIASARWIVEETKRLFPGHKLRVVCCGGDVPFFLPYMQEAENGGPDFTLRGILTVWRKYHHES